MTVLVTGAGGFIGRRVTAKLNEEKIAWQGFEGDVRRFEDFKSYEHCRAVLHLAGITRSDSDITGQRRMLAVNVAGALNASLFCLEKSRRFFLASSYTYGLSPRLPTDESTPTDYTDAYSFSKWLSEQTAFGFGGLFDLNGVIFRIFNVYGPGQPTGFLMSDILNGIQSGRLRLKELDSRRDFIYVDDLADLMVRAIKHPGQGMAVVNAGSGGSHSVGEVVDIFAELLDRRIDVDTAREPCKVPETLADITLAGKLFGWRPSIDIREGIRRILADSDLIEDKP